MESWILDLGLQRFIDNTRIAIEPLYSLSDAFERQKPYFGRSLSAFQSPPIRYALLASVAAVALRGKRKVRVLEIGSWAGASSITLGTVIRSLGITDSIITCVDSWEPYFVPGDKALHYKCMNTATLTGAIQQLFLHNIKACDMGGMIEVTKGGSRDVLSLLSDKSYDFIYIDGSHKKEDVVYDLEQAKRLVCEDGFICGDDLELTKADIDIEAHTEALNRHIDYVSDLRSGVSYHPGVTEAVADVFNEVWKEKGLWCVKRSGGTWSVPDVRLDDLDIPTHLKHAVEIPYGVFKDYELFQLGERFVAYPMSQPFWFQHRLMQRSLEELVLMIESLDTTNRTELIEEGYYCFNIVRHKGRWYGFHQSLGPTDIGSLGESAIEDKKRSGTCVSGVSAGDVKMEILRLAMGQLDQRVKDLQDETNVLYRALQYVYRKMGLENLISRQEFKS